MAYRSLMQRIKRIAVASVAVAIAALACVAGVGCRRGEAKQEASTMPTEQATEFSLDAYQWDRRPLLLFAPHVGDAAYRRQKDLLDPAAAELADRAVLMIEVIGDQASADGVGVSTRAASKLRQQFGPRGAGGGMLLILVGKDGTEKLRSDTPVEARAILDLIDSMPMRQQEQRPN